MFYYALLGISLFVCLITVLYLIAGIGGNAESVDNNQEIVKKG